MSEHARTDARATLRRIGLVGLLAGPLLLLVGITGAIAIAGADASASAPSVAYAGVFFVAVGCFGIIELSAGIVALRAASRLPYTTALVNINDALKFAAAIVAVVSSVAMMVLNEPPVVLVVVLLAIGLLMSLSASGKAMTPETSGK